MTEKSNSIQALFDKCATEKAKETDLSALDAALEAGGRDKLMRIGNLTRNNIDRILNEFHNPGMALLESKYLKELRSDFGYSNAPPIEKLMIDSINLAWLRWQYFEYIYTEQNKTGMTLEQAAFWEKRMTAAQGRFLKASTTYARIKKLARNDPTLQVNIAAPGGQQVNIAGDYKKEETIIEAKLEEKNP